MWVRCERVFSSLSSSMRHLAGSAAGSSVALGFSILPGYVLGVRGLHGQRRCRPLTRAT